MTANILTGIKAIFWDWDGTLVDSCAFLNETHNHVRASFGLDAISPQEFAEYFGKPRDYLYKKIYGAENMEAAKSRFEAYVIANHSKIKPMAGAKALLQTCHDAGFKMAVVTNKKSELVKKEIINHGWQDFFTVTVGAGEAVADKPSPEPLLLAIKRSGLAITPEEILFVGDTENDVICAYKAGAKIAFIEENQAKHQIAKDYNGQLIFNNCQEFTDFLLQTA